MAEARSNKVEREEKELKLDLKSRAGEEGGRCTKSVLGEAPWKGGREKCRLLRDLSGAVVPLPWQITMDGDTGTHLLSC